MPEPIAAAASANVTGDANSCWACRKAKRRCDKSIPCSRCVRLNRRCVQQTRGRGRPKRRGWRGPPRVSNPEQGWAEELLVPEDEGGFLQEDWCEYEEEGDDKKGGGGASAANQGDGEEMKLEMKLDEDAVPAAGSPERLRQRLHALASLTTMPLSATRYTQAGTGGVVQPPPDAPPPAVLDSSVEAAAVLPATAGSGNASSETVYQREEEEGDFGWVSVLEQPVRLPQGASLARRGMWMADSREDEESNGDKGSATLDDGRWSKLLDGGEVAEGPDRARYGRDDAWGGVVMPVPRGVGGASCIDLAYDACCRSMQELSIGGMIDPVKARFIAQGLEFVFVVMGSGFASPTLLRVMKEAASTAEERVCTALLSMRQKRRSTDMLETREQGEVVSQARRLRGSAEDSKRLQDTADTSHAWQEHMRREHGCPGSSAGPFWSVKIGTVSEVPTVAWMEELLCTPGTAGVQFVMARPDTTRTVQMLRTNALMAEHFISEAEFGLLGDQLKTMTPTVLARIMTDRSIHSFFLIIGAFCVVQIKTREDCEKSCFVELLNRRGEIVPALATVRRQFNPILQHAILGCRFWPLASLCVQGQMPASSGVLASPPPACENVLAEASPCAAEPPPPPTARAVDEPAVLLSEEEVQLLMGALT